MIFNYLAKRQHVYRKQKWAKNRALRDTTNYRGGAAEKVLLGRYEYSKLGADPLIPTQVS